MDIAIVGAGPAGARAAWVLARGGARVTMFDASHPREKPCGGGVTGRALELVADAIDATSFSRTQIHSARFLLRTFGASAGQVSDRTPSASAGQVPESAAEESATVALDGNALVVASRADFDAALVAAAQRAGAALERSRVTDVRVDAGGVHLETPAGSRRADFVIGADGANSLVRRRVARPFRRDQWLWAIEPDGGLPRRLSFGPANNVSYGPAGIRPFSAKRTCATMLARHGSYRNR